MYPYRMITRENLRFVGGPFDGVEVDGMMARVVSENAPPFVCVLAEGQYHHYLKETPVKFKHVGHCERFAQMELHPDCGHDHTDD